VAFGTAVLVLVLVGRAALAQTPEATVSVESALQQLRDAPNVERSQKRAALVALGQNAVAPLIAQVKQLYGTENTSLLINCIRALGELKAQEATAPLMEVLNGSDVRLVYFAAEALGRIWEGKGADTPQGKQLNAALLAVLYSGLGPELVFAPGIALVRVNSIPLQRAESLSAEELLSGIDAWVNGNSNAVPPVADQPWQLLLRTILTSRDAATRASATQALVQKRDLSPVEMILDALAAQQQPSDQVRQELAGLLNQLTGEPFPVEAASSPATPAAQVEAWRARWLARLKKETQPAALTLAWNELERSLRKYYVEKPTGEAAAVVVDYRNVVVHQLSDPSGMPASASPKAKELLTPALESKKRIAEAVASLEGTPSGLTKQVELGAIWEEARKPHSQQVCIQFLGRLVRLARAEAEDTVVVQMGNLLGLISGVPCTLDGRTVEERSKQLDEWINTIRMIGLPLELPTS
jgi:HEAT repeat protein